jgi:tetratricopeptide (TPR) repeat protein
VYEELGERQKALALFEKAVALKPNYALARFNLAEAYERVDRRRAIEEYETYLAIVEGMPEEATRARRAEQRLEQLTR